jgi:hypothetical protein
VALSPTSSRGGQVTSVFSRTGAVVAATNDYTDAQIQNSPTNVLSASGDILYASAANTLARLQKGSDTNVLTLASGLPSWAAPASSGALTLLSTTTRATDGTIDVSSISQAYSDLVIAAVVRGTDAGTTDTLKLVLNNDTASNYGSQRLQGTAATASATESNSAAFVSAGIMPAGGATAGFFMFIELTILGYTSTTWNKVVLIEYGYGTAITTGARFRVSGMGLWASTAAVNRITLSGFSTAALLTASTARIYGRS